MEEEYDYSMYATLCTINICPVSNELNIHQVNNRISEASTRYAPKEYLKIPLDFYYNKDNGNIIHGSLMISHYKQYPPHEKYVHVSNFVEDLYELYQRSCKGESATQDHTALCSAIKSFLAKVYPSQLSVDGQTFTTQYAFILPSQNYTNKDFINTTLRPLLQTTPWLTSNDSASKVIFYSRIDAYFYRLNEVKRNRLCLKRETKYLFCTLQKIHDQHQLLFKARFVRAVYDPDLVAASGRSMTALGGKTMLSPKLVSQPLSLKISTDPTLAKMNRLALFLYNKVFAGEVGDSSPTLLDEYKTDSNHRSLIHQLIFAILTSNFKDSWNEEIDAGDFVDDSWPDKLSKNMKSRLSLITYGEIMQLFDDVDTSSLRTAIGHYLQEYHDEELFQNIVVVEEDEDNELGYMGIKSYRTHNLAFANEYCQQFYLSRVKKLLVSFLKKQKESNKTNWGKSISPRDMTEGCAYKILKMVQLSNKLGRPNVVKSAGETKQASRKAPAIQQEKLALIDQIQPYGYYVEVNFSCSNEIKMSLSQVIETTAEDDRLHKSTMSILDSSWQTSDMYHFMFDTLWSNIDRHCADPQCKSLQEDESMDFDNYKTIRADLMSAIKSSMENASNVIHDLDEVIYHISAESGYKCDILITHRLVIDTGLLSYLKCIAGEIVASLKTKATFGNYKISCLLVTGEFLYKWLEQGNSTYGRLIWDQLRKEINSALNDKQLRIHLIMKTSIVLQDNNLKYKPLKVEKYKQVFSKHYFLKIYSEQKEDFRVFRDAGNHWVEVSGFETKEDYKTWKIPIIPVNEDKGFRPICKEKFYAVIKQKDINRVYSSIGLYALSKDQLENSDAAISSMMNAALLSHLSPPKVGQHQATFPLEVDISPCSYLSAINMKMRHGLGISLSDPLKYRSVAYSERLTLQELKFQ